MLVCVGYIDYIGTVLVIAQVILVCVGHIGYIGLCWL